MRCPACASDNGAANTYCDQCGALLFATCQLCGHKNSPAALFCGSCGQALDRQWPARSDTQNSSIVRERKQATVVFADIVSSTELIAGLDAEQAMERLRPAIQSMCEVVERFDGTVTQTSGDGIMAMFGAPRAQEGHALLACEAALAMQQAFSQLGGLKIRIGMHSGEVVSGVSNPGQRADPDPHGATIHLANRLEQIAKPGGICLTEDCYRLVRAYCDVRALGRRALRGFVEPIEIYELLGLKPSVTSRQFQASNLTSFRGRDFELGALQRALRNTENADAKVVGISGAPGAGKSRLCHEFAEWCRSRFIPVFEVRALIYGHAMPLRPILELLRLFFGIQSTDDAAATRRRVEQRMLAIDPAFRTDLPLLHEFLGASDREHFSAHLDPKARHARLLDIVRRMVRQSGTSTSVILIEDLHWLDEASEEFVAALVEAIVGTRTMLVLNYRPAYSATWMTWRYFEQLSLAELTPAATSDLVQELIGGHPETDSIRRQVTERSGGNPFFAEELVRSLAENSVLLGNLGQYRLGMRAFEGTLPATIQAVIGARIDRLGQHEKEILQIGAIIGKEFPLALLEQVAGKPLNEVQTLLGRLCDAELIQERAGVDARGFAFRHPLTQEVAYATQLKARRTALHAAVAQAAETFYQHRLDEFAGLLAYHFEASGRLLEAARYAARTASWIGTTDPTQAVKRWHQVRQLMQTQPRSHETDTLRIMASGQIAMFGWREGMTAEEAKPFIEEAIGWARLIDNTMIQMLLATEGRITVASGGQADVYVDRVKEALSLLKTQENVGRIATLNAFLGHAYNLAGLLREALSANTAALEGVSRIENVDHRFLGFNVEHWVRSLRGRILVRLGRFAEAEKCFDLMLRVEETLLDPAIQFIPHLGYVDLSWFLGDAALAEQHARRVGEIAEKSRIPYLQVYSYACTGTAKAVARDFDGALRDFIKGVEFARKARVALEYEPEMLASLADCYLRVGQSGAALAAARQAIDVAQQRSARLPECRASMTCAAALVSEHGPARLDEAYELLRHAESLIRMSGASTYEPLLARVRACLPARVS